MNMNDTRTVELGALYGMVHFGEGLSCPSCFEKIVEDRMHVIGVKFGMWICGRILGIQIWASSVLVTIVLAVVSSVHVCYFSVSSWSFNGLFRMISLVKFPNCNC